MPVMRTILKRSVDKRGLSPCPSLVPSRITNGMMKGFNSLVQAAKARARGYRTTKNLIAMICMIGGKLNFWLPT